MVGAEGLDQVCQPHQVELRTEKRERAAQMKADKLRKGICPGCLHCGQGGVQLVQIRWVGEPEPQAGDALGERLIGLVEGQVQGTGDTLGCRLGAAGFPQGQVIQDELVGEGKEGVQLVLVLGSEQDVALPIHAV